jgi:hypothetical protein
MYFLRQYRFVLAFLALLVFCSVMVIHQINARQTRHVELREALIILHAKGYTNEATHLYQHLLMDIQNLSNKQLIDDFQRTLPLVDPMTQHPENLIWKYHWTVSNELERREESTLTRALDLAHKLK